MNTTFNFAHTVIASLDNAIADVSCNIAALEKQLSDLREQQKHLENERQAMLTLAKAGESAIEQSANFLNMAKAAGREDMVQAFWDGIDALRDEKPQLPPVPEPQPQSEPTAPSAPKSPEVLDNWEAADKAINATEPNEVIDPTQGVIDAEVAEVKPEWHSLSWRELLTYAKSKGIATKGRKRGEIEADLLDLTNTD